MKPQVQPLLWKGAAVSTACDPYFSNAVLLLGFNGTNGSTTFTDESPHLHGNAFVVGAAQVSTAQFKFGQAGLFNGTSAQLNYPSGTDWYFGSSPFTVEAWIYPTSLSGITFIVGPWLSTPNLGWILYLNASANLAWNVSTTGSDNLNDLTGSTTLSVNTWYHVCVDYDGSKYRMYVNGVMVASATTPRTINNSTFNLGIGSNAAGTANSFAGYIDELRLTKGVARYASDSGFAVPTTAFPRIACATTWNPSDKSATITLSNGNLTASGTSTSDGGVRGTTSKASGAGKYFVEFTAGSTYIGSNMGVGVALASASLTVMGSAAANAFLIFPTGNVYFNGSLQFGIGTITPNSIVQMAIDTVNKRGWFKTSGFWNGSGSADPATNIGGVDLSTLLNSAALYPAWSCNNNGTSVTLNAGASAFTNSPPSGFVAWG